MLYEVQGNQIIEIATKNVVFEHKSPTQLRLRALVLERGNVAFEGFTPEFFSKRLKSVTAKN